MHPNASRSDASADSSAFEFCEVDERGDDAAPAFGRRGSARVTRSAKRSCLSVVSASSVNPAEAPKSFAVRVWIDGAGGSTPAGDARSFATTTPKGSRRAAATRANAQTKSLRAASASALGHSSASSLSGAGPRARAKITDAPAAESDRASDAESGTEEVPATPSFAERRRPASLSVRTNASRRSLPPASAAARKSARRGSSSKNSGATSAGAPEPGAPRWPAARLASRTSTRVRNRSRATPGTPGTPSPRLKCAATRRPASSASTSSSNEPRSARARTTASIGTRPSGAA